VRNRLPVTSNGSLTYREALRSVRQPPFSAERRSKENFLVHRPLHPLCSFADAKCPIDRDIRKALGKVCEQGDGQTKLARHALTKSDQAEEKRMVRNTIAGWLAAAALAIAGASAHGAIPGGVDLSGHSVEQLAPAGTKAVVLFFVASDCPISNRYIPEIEKLNAEFGTQGVLFWWIYPNPGDTAAVVKTHDAQFAVPSDTLAHTLLDAKQSLVSMAHVTITPEAAVFVPNASGLREVYHGRIDNRYIDFGQERPSATEHDLEEAIRAVLDHKAVPSPAGPPVGCSIVTRGVAPHP
jgi:hypothetical protein